MRMMKIVRYDMLLWITLSLWGVGPVFSQPTGLLFRWKGNLNENGLNFINDILFDTKGRVWIGGQTGFYRYDGYHYFPYRQTNDPNSLPNNFVHTLCQDKKGNIWGSTDDGIFSFDPEAQSFRNYRLPDTTARQSVYNIACDGDGNIWASTFGFLYRYNTRIDSFDIEAPLYKASDYGRANRIKKRGLLILPNSNRIWATTDEGIFYFDIASKVWKNVRDYPEVPLFQKRNTSALAQAINGNILFFDINKKEIVQFDPKRFSIIKTISVRNQIPDANAAVLFQSNDEKIWLSNWFNDVALIDPKKNDQVTLLKAAPNEPLALPSNFFWTARQDQDGTIWFGTTEGMVTTNLQKGLFQVHTLGKNIKGFGEKTSLMNFMEDKQNHSWWIHTSDQQVFNYFPDNGNYTQIPLDNAIANEWGDKPKTVLGLFYLEGNPVITCEEGAWVIQKTGQPMLPIEKFLKIKIPIRVKRMTTGEAGVYYMSDGKDLYKWRSSDQSLKKIYIKSKKPGESPVISLYEKDRTGSSNYAGLGIAAIGDLSADSVEPVMIGSNAREINRGAISDIDTDSSGTVWICYSALGLIRYDPKTGNLKRWDETNGLIVNSIAKIAIDHNQNVWAMHRRHFSVLMGGGRGHFNFSYPKGELNPTWFAFIHCLHNGNMVANNFNDIIEFFPSRLLQKPAIQKPDISSVFVNDIPVKHENDGMLKLNPDQNSLRFQFGLLTDRILFPYEIFYKLDGADKDWKIPGANYEAVYNELPPGTYTFRVKAISKNGIWETGEQTFALKILKPFYYTWWFFVLTAAILTGLLYAFYRFRLRKHRQIFDLESKTASLEREKATIQYDSLKQQLNPHFLFNSLTSLSGLIEADQQMAGDFLQRMSDMYRYILKNGGNDTVKLGDELRFVQLYIDIQQTRFGKGLQVNIDVPVDKLEYNIAPVTLQNLVENAIKHNIIDEGSPLIVRMYAENEYLVVSNNLQRKNMVEASNKTGLVQFQSLYSFLSEKPVIVEESDHQFMVKVPLI